MKTCRRTLFTCLSLFCFVITNAQTSKTVWTNNKSITTTVPQLTAFTVIEKSKQVSLSWSTSGEQNSTHFIVERSSNGLKFDSVGAVTALGRFQLPTSYEFVDLQPSIGTKFYRIKIVALDGTRDYGTISGIESASKISTAQRSAVAKSL